MQVAGTGASNSNSSNHHDSSVSIIDMMKCTQHLLSKEKQAKHSGSSFKCTRKITVGAGTNVTKQYQV